MTDKPKILTVAEIDNVADPCGMFTHLRALDNESCEINVGTLRSLCRMARAMAVQIESVAEATNIIRNQWAVTACTDWPRARRAVRAGLIEAIEATEEP